MKKIVVSISLSMIMMFSYILVIPDFSVSAASLENNYGYKYCFNMREHFASSTIPNWNDYTLSYATSNYTVFYHDGCFYHDYDYIFCASPSYDDAVNRSLYFVFSDYEANFFMQSEDIVNINDDFPYAYQIGTSNADFNTDSFVITATENSDTFGLYRFETAYLNRFTRSFDYYYINYDSSMNLGFHDFLWSTFQLNDDSDNVLYVPPITSEWFDIYIDGTDKRDSTKIQVTFKTHDYPMYFRSEVHQADYYDFSSGGLSTYHGFSNVDSNPYYSDSFIYSLTTVGTYDYYTYDETWTDKYPWSIGLYPLEEWMNEQQQETLPTGDVYKYTSFFYVPANSSKSITVNMSEMQLLADINYQLLFWGKFGGTSPYNDDYPNSSATGVFDGLLYKTWGFFNIYFPECIHGSDTFNLSYTPLYAPESWGDGSDLDDLGTFDDDGNLVVFDEFSLWELIKRPFIPSNAFMEQYLSDISSTFNNKIPFISQVSSAVSNLFSSISNITDSSPPEFTVTLYGQTMSVFDFSQFDTVRSIIQALILFFAYTKFFLYVWYQLPALIGRVPSANNVYINAEMEDGKFYNTYSRR